LFCIRPHVTLIDVKSNLVKEITETGVRLTGKDRRTEKDEYELDMIIYAVGFDVSTGPLTRLEVRGQEDQTLGEHWNKDLETYLGIMVEKFPNMFMMSGPQIPIANFPVVLDNTADWIGQCMGYMQKNGYKVLEPTREAMDKWGKLLSDIFEATVLPEAAKKAGSWYVGANIPGKPVKPLFWFGGVSSYFENCDAELKAGFSSRQMS
jgi:cation diffusion facilitator CzcD-associated flavoprotein CzcO